MRILQRQIHCKNRWLISFLFPAFAAAPPDKGVIDDVSPRPHVSAYLKEPHAAQRERVPQMHPYQAVQDKIVLPEAGELIVDDGVPSQFRRYYLCKFAVLHIFNEWMR